MSSLGPGIPSIDFPSDIKDAIHRLEQTARSTDEGVRACGQLDTATRAAWGDFLIGLLDFTKANANPGILDMTGSLMDRLQGYGRQLFEWQQKIHNTCPNTIVFNPGGGAPGQTLSTLATIAQWGAVAALAIGGAYAVGKLVEVAEVFGPKRENPIRGDVRLRRKAMKRAYPGRNTGGWDPWAPDKKVDREYRKLRRA